LSLELKKEIIEASEQGAKNHELVKKLWIKKYLDWTLHYIDLSLVLTLDPVP
jgi:hypothetical protein